MSQGNTRLNLPHLGNPERSGSCTLSVMRQPNIEKRAVGGTSSTKLTKLAAMSAKGPLGVGRRATSDTASGRPSDRAANAPYFDDPDCLSNSLHSQAWDVCCAKRVHCHGHGPDGDPSTCVALMPHIDGCNCLLFMTLKTRMLE